MMEIRIKPTRLLFFNEDDFYGIYGAEVSPDDLDKGVELNQYGNISIKGFMPKLSMKEEYTVVIKPDTQGNYRGSYILESIKQDKPQTIEDQKTYLSSILTETQIKNIYDVYSEKDNIIELIEKGEFDYKKVKGFGEKTFETLQKKVMDNMDMSEILTFCKKHDIKYSLVAKLVKEYKNPTIVIQKIDENPYILTEVKGIGFKKADIIAKAVGYSMTSPNRIDSAIWYIINEESQSGHSWISFKPLLNRAIDLLNIDKTYILKRLDSGVKNVKRVDEDRFTTVFIYDAEEFVAQKLIQFKSSSKMVFTVEEIDSFLVKYCEENDVELEENQRQFFYDWNENNVLALVGGGGMGKSWLINILLQLIDTKNRRVALLSPTGKASKVLANYTGREASTIHRRAGVFEHEEEGTREILEDVIIVDESSMCDIFILSNLFSAIRNDNARILFIGDDFQLPSVGVGNFLYDIIHSTCIKISRLKKVFRQDEGGILDVSTKVRNGEVFLDSEEDGRKQFGKDCVFWLTDQKFVRDGVITNYKNVIKKFHQDDVVILSPTNKGKLGTFELNKEIQKIANPKSAMKKEKTVGSKDNPVTFRVGDTVMNTVNTYGIETVSGGKADIFNGDTGKIIDIEDKHFIIELDGIKVKIESGKILTQIVHSWVTTIHKSQGSQYKVVIVVVDKSAKFQLNANLIYTGFSRAKKFMLVLGQSDTINHGIGKFANMERRSFLQELLHSFNGNTEFKTEVKEEGEDNTIQDNQNDDSRKERVYF